MWTTAFLDTPADAPGRAEALEFWLAVTSSRLSPRRGDRGEFATLLPPDGDAYLRVQDTGDGEPSCHLDLHVDDVRASAREARRAGARVDVERDDLAVLRSPAGLPFCLVPVHNHRRRPPPVTAPNGSTGLVDQLCIDLPAESFDRELRWWSNLTGWALSPSVESELIALTRPPELPLRLLFQRQLEPTGPGRVATAHLDVACDDRAAQLAHHQALGATHLRHTDGWDILRDPCGRIYCVTDRDPRTGRVVPS
jgi:hypothetical protein